MVKQLGLEESKCVCVGGGVSCCPLPHFAILPHLWAPPLHTSFLPVAPCVPGAGWGRRESPTSLASSPVRPSLSLEAEPFGDNFDSHNDAGGNHFKEDQSSLKSAHLLRLRPTLLDLGASCRFALSVCP